MEAFSDLKDNLKVPLFMEIPIIPALGYMYSQKKRSSKTRDQAFQDGRKFTF
jgi:hypothetical protein